MLSKILCASMIFGSLAVYAENNEVTKPLEDRQQQEEVLGTETFEASPEDQKMEDLDMEKMEDHSDYSEREKEELDETMDSSDDFSDTL